MKSFREKRVQLYRLFSYVNRHYATRFEHLNHNWIILCQSFFIKHNKVSVFRFFFQIRAKQIVAKNDASIEELVFRSFFSIFRLNVNKKLIHSTSVATELRVG